MLFGFAPWSLHNHEDIALAEDFQGFSVDDARDEKERGFVVIADVAVREIFAEGGRRERIAVYLVQSTVSDIY